MTLNAASVKLTAGCSQGILQAIELLSLELSGRSGWSKEPFAPCSVTETDKGPRRLPDGDFRRKSTSMFRYITMDDRARMPWRFYGAARAVLARA